MAQLHVACAHRADLDISFAESRAFERIDQNIQLAPISEKQIRPVGENQRAAHRTAGAFDDVARNHSTRRMDNRAGGRVGSG
jgi:hypothetical protein